LSGNLSNINLFDEQITSFRFLFALKSSEVRLLPEHERNLNVVKNSTPFKLEINFPSQEISRVLAIVASEITPLVLSIFVETHSRKIGSGKFVALIVTSAEAPNADKSSRAALK
jgi:hypothetical protein